MVQIILCVLSLFESLKVPRMHLKSTLDVPQKHLGCTSDAPQKHLGCTSKAPRMHLKSTSDAPRMHIGCTSDAPRMHLKSTQFLSVFRVLGIHGSKKWLSVWAGTEILHTQFLVVFSVFGDPLADDWRVVRLRGLGGGRCVLRRSAYLPTRRFEYTP